MMLGPVVALFADIHGASETLRWALTQCEAAGVTTVALLGDLIDRVDQADACARALTGWHVVGVYGNHEQEIVLAAAQGALRLSEEAIGLLTGLQERLVIEDACFLHAADGWGHANPMTRLFGAAETPDAALSGVRVTFAGHTHYRHARDERGPLDIARGRITLDPRRRYLINPGALADGRFAIWERTTRMIRFCQAGREWEGVWANSTGK